MSGVHAPQLATVRLNPVLGGDDYSVHVVHFFVGCLRAYAMIMLRASCATEGAKRVR